MKVLSTQHTEYQTSFRDILKRQGIDILSEIITDYGPGKISEYRYHSPRFGDVYAYEMVAQYDVDGFAQSIVIVDEPITGNILTELNRIIYADKEKAPPQQRRGESDNS